MPESLRARLVTQCNVVAMWQMPTAGRRAAARAVRRGEWRRLTSSTFLASPADPLPQQLVWAAVLHGGRSARLCGRTALVLHGWDGDFGPVFHVAVPHNVQPASAPPWLRVHRLSVALVGPRARPTRTSVHLSTAHAAAWARTDREAMFIVISVLQQRLTAPHRLRSALQHLPKLPRRRLTAEIVDEFSGGAHSLNELDFKRLCRRFDVPQPERQVRRLDAGGTLRAIDVEFLTRSGRVLRLEIEGMQHLNPANYFADISRHNQLQVVDPAVGLRVASWVLRHEPAQFMRDLRRWVLEA